MKISSKTWQNYIKRLAKINVRAAGDVVSYMVNHDVSTSEGTKALIDYANAVSTKYGEAAAELSCQMYDAIATVSKAGVPAAEPAATATYGEIAKTIYGTLASTKNPDAIGAAVGRKVKLASVDTLQQNALRDGAEWAWIPAGDTCPFCLMLASNGWQKASKKAIKNGHASHIHNNCDCTYCVRFDHETTVEGYDPDALYDEYINAGDTPKERLNALSRQHYAANREYINAQKRAAYARRMSTAEPGNSKAENGSETLKNERNLDRILNKETIRYGSPTKVSQDAVDKLINNELSGIRFDESVIVNPRLKRAQGRVIPKLSETNRETGVERIEIGRQDRNTKECLINTLVHENLESKILKGYIEGNDKYWKLYQASDDERHEYIDKVIKRYFRMKGWDYEKSY